MSESVLPTGPDLSPVGDERPPRRRTPQLGLSSLLLMTACIAAWGSTWLNKQQIAQLQQRVTSLKALTHELVVQDRKLISIVRQQPRFYDQERWHLHVPNDSLGLYLTTRGVPSKPGQIPSNAQGQASSAPLTSGHHVVELKSDIEGDQWITQVLVDGRKVMIANEPERWKPPSYIGGGRFDKQADLPADRPAVLFHRAISDRVTMTGSVAPTEQSRGIMLWIDQSSTPPKEKR